MIRTYAEPDMPHLHPDAFTREFLLRSIEALEDAERRLVRDLHEARRRLQALEQLQRQETYR